jgi:alkylation response protein AidB-like acyl-CoA dehydrogenase
VNLSLSETHESIRASIRQQLQREMSWERVGAALASGQHDGPLWQRLSFDGWLGLAFPESAGGGGAELLDIAVALEELSRAAAVVPFAETMACAYTLTRAGTDEGRAALAAAILENAGAVTPAVGPQASSDGLRSFSAGTLRGSARYVDYGSSCTHHLVAALEDGRERLFLVDARVPGVSQRSLHNIGHTPQSTTSYADVAAVPAGGEEAVVLLTRVSTVLCCVQLLAFAQQALDLTVGYVRDRVQFGRPLGSFQAVQQQVADMASAVEATRYLTYEAVWKVDHGTATAADLATAKAAASRTAVSVTLTAHQLHGGMGMTEEYPLHFFSRWAKERSLAWGSEHESLAVLAGSIADEVDWR